MPDSLGSAAQVRAIAEQVSESAAEIAVKKFAAMHPELQPTIKADIPPPLKWASGIIATLFVLGIGGTATWLVTTVNTMQVTLARMDERMAGQGSAQISRDDDQDRRISRLEQLLESGSKK